MQTLQVNHGGWCDAMFECIGSTGIILGFDEDHDAEVIYPSGNIWTLNPNVFTLTEPDYIGMDYLNIDNTIQHAFPVGQTLNTKLNANKQNNKNISGGVNFRLNENISTDVQLETNFALNDLVEVCSDLERVKLLQRGHGEFCPAMLSVNFF